MNYELLKQTCLAPIESFTQFGDVQETNNGIYIYRENPKAKILGVAHLDSVLDLDHFYALKIGGQDVIMNAQLDDRLGAYTLLYVLPELGIEFDLLLTEGEETGHSTAAWFESNKEYNWMFSFDRRGGDVVFYQYDHKEIRDDVKDVGMIPAIGSFSDIAFLDHLKCCGMNIGTGYYGEHTDMCHADISVWARQVGRFRKFYNMFEDKCYPYVKPHKAKIQYPIHYYNDRFIGYARYDEWETGSTNVKSDVGIEKCYLCHEGGKALHEITEGIRACTDCYSHCDICTVCSDVVYAEEVTDGICTYCKEEIMDDV